MDGEDVIDLNNRVLVFAELQVYHLHHSTVVMPTSCDWSYYFCLLLYEYPKA